VYAGIDPVTGRRHYLKEIIKVGPKAQREAEAARSQPLNEVAEKRSPRTSATVDQLLDRYLDPVRLIADHAGSLPHARPQPHLAVPRTRQGRSTRRRDLDSFYGELRRCRRRCSDRRTIEHRVAEPHECTERSVPHQCKPLAPTTIRHIHFILSGAYKRAVRWRWLTVNPMAQAEPPPAPKPNPRPPTAAQAARIVNESWRDRTGVRWSGRR
jgi:hypothetical protein